MVTVPTPPAASAEIGRRVKQARLAKGMTQQQVADRAAFKRPTVSYLEQGRRNLTVGSLLSLADALGIDPCDLIRDLPRY